MPIKLKNVSCIYNPKTPFEVYALKEIDLEISDGSYVAIIGQTGSGKSTLIQHFNGLILPSSGSVTVNQLAMSDKKNRRQIRKDVGIVFQYPEHQLFEETVFKDIAFGPTNMGMSKNEIEKAVISSLKAVGLSEDLLEESPFDLSGGQMRRVAIAGVLAMSPKILVLDEPTAGLDPKARHAILQMINKIHQKHKITIILVTHDMEQAAAYASRVVVMNNGTIVYDGKPREVFKNINELKELGLDVPPVTLLCYKLKQLGYKVPQLPLTISEAKEIILKNIGVKSNAE
ncbi:energy-coupling factor transporter ATPase [Clostridium sp. 'deep sea']|uniref:energy-coupling factor transporter ATPase n=1 Tax=Clostridium sp. 'deep sea' TaxID=2779445 RepID=UPI00189677B4|nr:energy-coupling factor transporter ATPase [Clostridium sp. 'deep sea']QOR34607.1 energy-coupling factor transporter ATPase [Clostridium sp. 'deep sea']